MQHPKTELFTLAPVSLHTNVSSNNTIGDISICIITATKLITTYFSATCRPARLYLFLCALWRPPLDMSDEVFVKVSCQARSEGAGGVHLTRAAGRSVGQRGTGGVWSCAQHVLAAGARQAGADCVNTIPLDYCYTDSVWIISRFHLWMWTRGWITNLADINTLLPKWGSRGGGGKYK